ncbi:hypothetical protein [Sediminitomix flava]|uniref:Uncharacterized protein n=1 Tax=Sediminitomix flava TaxID=379075 RepID=A0A315ZH03_SEDFL|nr:hypothetical protein [Sediminitomix flava]PWJ44885.1 hypothetical protein BC781_1011274 [Sediminitomix flava]
MQILQELAREDGFIENLTVIILLMSAAISWIHYRKKSSIWSKSQKANYLLMTLFFVFLAGEEISWGQRILDIESNEFFVQHNAQAETNLHNMVIGDTKVNKLFFGKLITVALVMYLFITPIAATRWEKFNHLIQKTGLPIGNLIHGIVFIVGVMLISLLDGGYKWEYYELLVVGIVFSIVYKAFAKDKNSNPAIVTK